MSKRSLFWGTASGKLGETVHYRAGGEQRVRAYVAQVKNPKTLAQMANRLSMANFSAVYRSMAEVLKWSFPNRPSNQSGYNALLAANKGHSSAAVTSAIAAKGLCVPVDMIVSRGSLGIDTSLTYGTVGNGYGFKSSIPVIVDGSSPKNITTGVELANALDLSGDNPLMLPANVKVTVVFADYQDDAFRVRYAQLQAGTEDVMRQFADFGYTLCAVPTSNGAGTLAVMANTEGANIGGEVMAAVIFSYTGDDGKLHITTSRIASGDADSDYVTQFLPDGDVWKQVLETLGYNMDSYLATSVASISGSADGGTDNGDSSGDGGADSGDDGDSESNPL